MVNKRHLWLTVRSLGRPWWTSYNYCKGIGVKTFRHDRFHWTEKAARARHAEVGGEILRRRGLDYWDYPVP